MLGLKKKKAESDLDLTSLDLPLTEEENATHDMS